MFSSFLCLSLLLTGLAQLVVAENDTCSDSWLFVDIHYRAVDSRNDTHSYGLFIGAGTTSQNQSLWPSITSNETSLASHDFCGLSSPANCDNPKHTHGHFGGDASSTWIDTPQYASLDLNAADQPMNITYGQDSLNLFTHYFDPSPASKYVVAAHPLSIMSDSTSEQDVFFNSGSLGLGSASTLLTQLADEGRINRQVFGMYLGTAYPRAGGVVNGSIVLGGYDAGRLEGDVHKYSQIATSTPDNSPFRVRVKQMALVTSDGTSIGLITDDGFDAHVSTSQYAMELPSTQIQHLTDALRATSANTPEGTLQLPRSFNGNFTITLDDGFEISYPSEWISNDSNITPFSASTLNSTNTTSRPLVFGAAFLHHLYMTVDYEDSSFYLANAKLYDNYVQPRSLCAGTAPVALGPPDISKFTQSGMIGAIIGGLLAGFGIAWLAIYALRKRLQYTQSRDRASKLEAAGTGAIPKKSSLRRRSQFGGILSRKKRSSKGVVFSDVKDMDGTDSETSSIKGKGGVTVTVERSGSSEAGIELSSMNSKNGTSASPVSPITPHQTNTTTTKQRDPLPNPSTFANPYTTRSPLPTPYDLATPRTGNPLLSDFHSQYSNIDDDDTSDLYHTHPQSQPRFQHKRTASDQMRNKLGLTVNTVQQGGVEVAQTTAKSTAPSLGGRQKPAPLPLPLRVASENATPASSARRGGGGKKSGLLRRVFPS